MKPAKVTSKTSLGVPKKNLPLSQSTNKVTQAAPQWKKPPPDGIVSLSPARLELNPVKTTQNPVPGLEYGLDRVLFNPGIYHLQDPQSRVYNFDPYLQSIMPVGEFDFNALKEYKTSSEDSALLGLARSCGKRYIGSTSSMTNTLAQFHFLLSNFRPLNLSMFSRTFTSTLQTYTQIVRAPSAIFLRWRQGVYAIDADKEFDGANVLMLLGKSLEKLLTLPKSDFERYRKSDPRCVTEEERNAPETFEYTTMGDFLMRAQLDAHDPRLPGTGTFDLKTRACLPVRMDAQNFQPMLGYEIRTEQGDVDSYEREYHDMMRSTMVKYLLQVRMGRMEGIFVAYHNIERIFGFQYLSVSDMDRAIHGQTDPCLGDQEFKLSVELLNKVLEQATRQYPSQTLRLHFDVREEPGMGSVMWVFAEPVNESEMRKIQSAAKAKMAEFEKKVMGMKSPKAEETPMDPNETIAMCTVRGPEHDVQVSHVEVDEGTSEATDPRSGSQATSETLDLSASPIVPVQEEVDSGSTESPVTAKSTAPNSSNCSSEDVKPLFAASITIRHLVNGEYVFRPSNMKSGHDWKIEYLLETHPASSSTWARYEAVKERRHRIFTMWDESKNPATSDKSGETSQEKTPQKNSYWLGLMREFARRGREFREELEAIDEKRDVVVFEPLSARKTTSLKVKENRAVDTDGYLKWLFGADRQ